MEINSKQRVILKILIGVIAIMFLIPPFRQTAGMGGFSCGYQFFFADTSCGLDGAKLTAQFIGTLIIGGAIFLLAKDKGKK